MNKRISIAFFLVSIILAGQVFAQSTELPDPGLTPANPFYFLEMIVEGVGNFFAFGDERKAERHVLLASERIAELRAMSESGAAEQEVVEAALKRYRKQLTLSSSYAEKLQNQGEITERVSRSLARATSQHLGVLEEVQEKVPQGAKGGVKEALERSKAGHIVALKSLSKENPQEATQMNIESARERLEKAEQSLLKGDTEEFENRVRSYEQLQVALEAVRGDNKDSSLLAVQERIRDMERLQEMEDRAEGVSQEAVNRIRETKTNTNGWQESSLRDIAGEDPGKAAEMNLRITEKKLERAEEIAGKGGAQEVEGAMQEFENQYKFCQEISQIAQQIGKGTSTVEQLVGLATSRHLGILSEVYEKAPEQAKQAVERAMETSAQGHQNAVQSLKRAGNLGEVPEEVPLSETIPLQVRERISTQIREQAEGEAEGPGQESPGTGQPEETPGEGEQQGVPDGGGTETESPGPGGPGDGDEVPGPGGQ